MMGMRVGGMGLGVALSVVLVSGAAPSWAATFVVTSAQSTGPGSLEQAIDDANANPGPDRIEFNIPPPSLIGGHVILAPVGGFPDITDPVVIDGYTQTGATPATDTEVADINITLDGSNAAVAFAGGLHIFTDDSTVQGLAVRDFPSNGVGIVGNRNRVQGCHIGTDSAGTAAGDNLNGVYVNGDDNQIGGVTPAERNVISANASDGLVIAGAGNSVFGNYIGTDATGSLQLGNSMNGIHINGTNTLIGDTVDGAGNVISGNLQAGILVTNTGNRIRGNLIGVNAGASAPLFNNVGITIVTDGNVVGGRNPAARNVISGNTFEGIDIISNRNVVQGNFIGTDGTGSQALPNYVGMRIDGDTNVIGGLARDAGNVVSGNTTDGIVILTTSAQPDPSRGNAIQSNAVGTNVDRTGAVGNGGSGIVIQGGHANLIGLTTATANVVAGNGGHGILLESDPNQDTHNNLVLGNHIGTNETGAVDLGNGGSGVFIDGGERNWIGGVVRNAGNIIVFNDGDGITVASGVENAFLGNGIHTNEALPIDLGADGSTGNDADDPDAGANNFQNRPEVVSAVLNAKFLTVEATLDSIPGTNFRIEFSTNAGCQRLGVSEGMRTFKGALTIRTDAAGDAVVTPLDLLAGSTTTRDGVVATATELSGQVPRSTSEVSLCSEITN